MVWSEETTRSDRVPLTPTSRLFQKHTLCPFRFRVPSRSVGRNLHTPPLRAVRRGGGQPLWDRGPTSVPRRPNPAGLGDHRWMVWGGEKQNQLSSHTKRRWFGFVVDTRQSSSVSPVRRHAAKAHTTHLTASMALQRLVVGNQHPFHLSILHDGLH